MLAAGTDRYGAVHSPLFASVLLIASPPILPHNVTLSQFFPPGGGIFRPGNFPNVFLGAGSDLLRCTVSSREKRWHVLRQHRLSRMSRPNCFLGAVMFPM
jgi:hypothetical protein